MGETIEETVRREVAEEVGVPVKTVEYIGSQVDDRYRILCPPTFPTSVND